MTDGFFPNDCTVSIGEADGAVASCTDFTAYITSWNQSGGDIETETIKVFGGSNLHKKNQRGEIEVSFDFIMRSTNALLFESLWIGGSTIVGSGTTLDSTNDPDEKVVYMQLLDEDGAAYKTLAYNNAVCTSYEASMETDGYAQGSVTLKLAPTDTAGAKNLQVTDAAASTLSW